MVDVILLLSYEWPHCDSNLMMSFMNNTEPKIVCFLICKKNIDITITHWSSQVSQCDNKTCYCYNYLFYICEEYICSWCWVKWYLVMICDMFLRTCQNCTRVPVLPCSQVQESITKLVLLPLERLALYRPAEVSLRHHDGQSSQHHLVSIELVSALELQMKVKRGSRRFHNHREGY